MPIEVLTLAGWVGAVSTALSPLVARIEAHVRPAARLHVDDTPVPVLAKGRTRTGRLWTVVRDDRPFAGPDPPAAAYFYSSDRAGAHAETWLQNFSGIMQADAFSGHSRLAGRGTGPNAGDLVAAGSCTGLAQVLPGQVIEARFAELGSVSLRLC